MELITDIEKAKVEKKYDPRYLIRSFECYFKSIDETYPTSFREIMQYRSRFKTFFLKGDEFKVRLKELASIEKAVAENASKAMDNAQRNLEPNINEEELQKISTEAKKYIDVSQALFEQLKEKVSQINSYDFGTQEFRVLIKLREDFRYRNKLGTSALSSLMLNNFLDFAAKILLFSFSFFLAFYLGDYLETQFQGLGHVYSKLIPAIIFYFTSEKVLKWLETIFLWDRAEYLSGKHADIENLVIQKEHFAANF